MFRKVANLVTGAGAGLSALLWAATPAFAAINLCGNESGQGLNVSGICAVTVDTLVPQIVNTALFIAFVAALVFLIKGGIMWILSGGDKEGTAKAKEAVTAALIGLAVVLGSWILINIVLNFFGSPQGLQGLTTPKLVK